MRHRRLKKVLYLALEVNITYSELKPALPLVIAAMNSHHSLVLLHSTKPLVGQALELAAAKVATSLDSLL